MIKITSRGKKSIVAIIIFIALAMAVVVIIPSIYDNNCKTRVYSDLEEKLDDTVVSANITIMMYEAIETGNVTSDSCEYIGTGVIIDSDEQYYYALTAAHVVNFGNDSNTVSGDEEGEKTFTCYYALNADAPTLSEAREASEEYLAIDGYCALFPAVEMEYISENNDIAILKFHSDEEFTSLNLASDDPGYDDRIIAVGENESVLGFYYGKITSKGQKTFQADDGRTAQVLYTNAYVIPGFSGGAVLNENMEIAGMIVGGGTDFLGRFRYGAILPVSIIADEVEQWKAK